MNKTLKKFLEQAPHREVISPKQAEEFYSFGFSLYGAGNFKEAADVFEVLSVQWPLNAKHWFALASARQENKEYDKALHAWAMTAILNTEDPYAHFHAAECCLSLAKHEDAALALEAAFIRAKENPDLQKKIHLLRQQWKLDK